MKEKKQKKQEIKSKNHVGTRQVASTGRSAEKRKMTSGNKHSGKARPNWYYSLIAAIVTCVMVVILFFFGGKLWRFAGGLVNNGFGNETIDWSNDSIYTDMPDGIDLSHHQNDIEWQVVGAHPTVKFVYLKATEGATHQDKRYKRHYNNARDAGLQIGSYHFYQPRVPVMEQVDNFVSHTDFSLDNLRPMIDIEIQKGMKKKALQDSLRLCLDTLTAIIGDKPILYTSRSFYHDVLEERFGAYPLWIADYRHGESLPSNCVLWQYTDKGKVLGVRHETDCNKLIKNLSDIQL